MLATATKGYRYFPPGNHARANRFTGLGISLPHLPEYSWASYALTQCQDLQASACPSLTKRTQRPLTVRCLSYHKSRPGVMPPLTVHGLSITNASPSQSRPGRVDSPAQAYFCPSLIFVGTSGSHSMAELTSLGMQVSYHTYPRAIMLHPHQMVMFLMPRHPSASLSPVARDSNASRSGELIYRLSISGFFLHTGGPSLHRLRTCFPGSGHTPSKQQPWIEACSFPASQRMFPLHLVLSLHRSGITTRPTSPCPYFHDQRGISHERVSESELQTAEKTV